ncbi:unnamed protein product [Mortierella alpina]
MFSPSSDSSTRSVLQKNHIDFKHIAMGGLNNFYSFLSNRVLPQSPPSPQSTNSDKENFFSPEYSQPNIRRSYSEASPALLRKEQTIHQLYPCEDRHSFNPHYQHNLHTQASSPAYSTPPSLSSSPTNSSPSSITSSSRSHSAMLTQSLSQVQKPYYQQAHPRRPLSYQQQQQHQQQQQQYQQHQHQPQQTRLSRSNSLNRQQARRPSLRNHANQPKQQQHFEYMDDDLMVGYDNTHIYYGSGASTSTSMARVHPNGSPSYTSSSSSYSASSASGSDRQHNNQARRTSHISYSSSHSSENERSTMSPASRSLSAAAGMSKSNNNAHGHHHALQLQQQQQQQQQQHRRASYLLPSISETTVTMASMEAEADEEDADSMAPRPSSASSSASSSSLSPLTAKQSLMRIAQCDIRQDGWCSQQSGQWSRHYAETHSRGMMTDGRRARRL